MKKILLLSSAVLFCMKNISAQSEEPNNPAFASYSLIGCLACPGGEWSNYNNIMLPDAMYADVQLAGFPLCFQTTCFYSRYLMAANFGFSIPAGAAINGVKAEMLRMTNASPAIGDTIVQIFTPGFLGTNHASPMPWTPAPVYITYGDSIDLWGLSLSADTVNLPGFGFRVMIRNGSSSTSLSPSSVDHIRMTVYYSLPTGEFSQTRTANNFSVYYDGKENSLVLFSAAVKKINSVSVIDLTGREIYSSASPDAAQRKFFLPDLVPGVYFAVVRADEKTTALKFAVNK